MANHGRTDSSDGTTSPPPRLPRVSRIVLDRDALVRVGGAVDSREASAVVATAVEEVAAAGATDIVLDLAEVPFAGLDLVTALAGSSGADARSALVVLAPPKTMLLALSALGARHLLDLREEPGGQ